MFLTNHAITDLFHLLHCFVIKSKLNVIMIYFWVLNVIRAFEVITNFPFAVDFKFTSFCRELNLNVFPIWQSLSKIDKKFVLFDLRLKCLIYHKIVLLRASPFSLQIFTFHILSPKNFPSKYWKHWQDPATRTTKQYVAQTWIKGWNNVCKKNMHNNQHESKR